MRWREGKDLPPGGDRLAPPGDPGARYGVKRGQGRTGCKAHLTETRDDDAPRLITNVETTSAAVDDAEMTAAVHQRPAGRRLTPGGHAADAGYVSARSVFWSDQRKPAGIPVARVHFALADCGPSPLRPRCAKAANGRYGRSLTLLSREQHGELARQRARRQTPGWKARYNLRAGVEGTISQAVRATRLRRTPYPGQDKTRLANVLNATAVNLIRADAWLNGTPLGTTRVSHLARLDPAA